MSQFTKGEWHYDSVGNYIRLRENEAILAAVMHAYTFEEKQANGRLMAVAPKMYELLNQAFHVLQRAGIEESLRLDIDACLCHIEGTPVPGEEE